jgi:formamidopyrimidine-DNA glycosylase
VPELPEVQAHAERLTGAFGGTVLEGFRPLTFTVLKTARPDPGEARDRPLGAVARRGKHLLLGFPDPDLPDDVAATLTFVVHLMLGGRLRVDEKQAAKPRGGQARWRFHDGRALLLTEAGTEHRAGVWVVAGDPLTQEPLGHLGPEADQLTLEGLAEQLSGTSVRLHGFLRDQRQLAGIGRRLANEVCHRARLSPFATTRTLTADEVARLHAAIGASITDGLAFERGSDDMSSAKDRPGAVHHRTGRPCPVCGDAVREVAYNAYTVHYCATCQTGGKVLADNSTSRFLK